MTSTSSVTFLSEATRPAVLIVAGQAGARLCRNPYAAEPQDRRRDAPPYCDTTGRYLSMSLKGSTDSVLPIRDECAAVANGGILMRAGDLVGYQPRASRPSQLHSREVKRFRRFDRNEVYAQEF